jgi:hypothetical protein
MQSGIRTALLLVVVLGKGSVGGGRNDAVSRSRHATILSGTFLCERRCFCTCQGSCDDRNTSRMSSVRSVVRVTNIPSRLSSFSNEEVKNT